MKFADGQYGSAKDKFRNAHEGASDRQIPDAPCVWLRRRSYVVRRQGHAQEVADVWIRMVRERHYKDHPTACVFLFREFRVYAIGRKAKTEIPASPS